MPSNSGESSIQFLQRVTRQLLAKSELALALEKCQIIPQGRDCEGEVRAGKLDSVHGQG